MSLLTRTIPILRINHRATIFMSYRIYTRTGDKGKTSLNPRTRLPKTDPIFEALGTNDELSCHLGLAVEQLRLTNVGAKLQDRLQTIQSRLQDINSSISASDSAEYEAKELEGWIDEMEAELSPLRNFILPVITSTFQDSSLILGWECSKCSVTHRQSCL